MTTDPKRPSPRDPEVLDTGQEEVFSRTEVELGRTEHGAAAGKPDAPGKTGPKATPPRRDGGRT